MCIGKCGMREDENVIIKEEVAIGWIIFSYFGTNDFSFCFFLLDKLGKDFHVDDKEHGGMGSPCLSPLVALNFPSGVPFRRMENEDEKIHLWINWH